MKSRVLFYTVAGVIGTVALGALVGERSAASGVGHGRAVMAAEKPAGAVAGYQIFSDPNTGNMRVRLEVVDSRASLRVVGVSDPVSVEGRAPGARVRKLAGKYQPGAGPASEGGRFQAFVYDNDLRDPLQGDYVEVQLSGGRYDGYSAVYPMGSEPTL